MAYDIFISYRRDGGKEWARSLKSELDRRGYRVFLDFDELKDGIFDRRIMDAIDSSPIFMILLSPHALDRCVNTDDWVRCEIEYALKCNRHFVPINPDLTFDDFPPDIPEELKKGLGQHQFSEVMFGQLFMASIDKMVRDRIEPLLQRVGRAASSQEKTDSTLKIETDLACQIYVDYEPRGKIYPNKMTRLPLRGGSYRLRFESMEDPADFIEDKDFRIAHNAEEWYTVTLLPIKQKHQQEKREQYLLGLPDERFVPECGSANDGNILYGFRDKQTGEILIPFRYDYAWNFSEDLARVKKSGKYGYIDKSGREVVSPIYDKAGNFSEGLARIEKSGKWGFIDKTNREVIPLIYDYADFFRDGLAIVEISGNWGFIDKTNHEVIPLIYDYADFFKDGLAQVKKFGKWGYIDKTDREVIQSIYDSAESFSEGLARVGKSGKYGYIDKTGHEVIPLIYDSAESFSGGLACVKKFGKWGFIDKTNHEVIPLIYDSAVSFSEGLAMVKKSGKRGFVDKTNHEVIPLIYDSADSFSEGLARVEKSGKWGFIDKTNHEVIPLIYDDSRAFSEGLARVKESGKWSFVDKTGREIIPSIYDDARDFSNGLARVKKSGKWGFIDRRGNWIKDKI